MRQKQKGRAHPIGAAPTPHEAHRAAWVSVDAFGCVLLLAGLYGILGSQHEFQIGSYFLGAAMCWAGSRLMVATLAPERLKWPWHRRGALQLAGLAIMGTGIALAVRSLS